MSKSCVRDGKHELGNLRESTLRQRLPTYQHRGCGPSILPSISGNRRSTSRAIPYLNKWKGRAIRVPTKQIHLGVDGRRRQCCLVRSGPKQDAPFECPKPLSREDLYVQSSCGRNALDRLLAAPAVGDVMAMLAMLFCE